MCSCNFLEDRRKWNYIVSNVTIRLYVHNYYDKVIMPPDIIIINPFPFKQISRNQISTINSLNIIWKENKKYSSQPSLRSIYALNSSHSLIPYIFSLSRLPGKNYLCFKLLRELQSTSLHKKKYFQNMEFLNKEVLSHFNPSSLIKTMTKFWYFCPLLLKI